MSTELERPLTNSSILGTRVLRRSEDPALLRGDARFIADIDVVGAASIGFVRSPIAHATVRSIEYADALELDGVIGVWTAHDLDLPAFQSWPAMPQAFARPPLAVGKVRFVGDIVAAVVADSPALVADALDAVWCDYEPLPAVIDPTRALEPGAPLLFDDVGSNLCFETSSGPEHDPTEGAAHVSELEMTSQRLAGVPMECNGCIADPTGPNEITLYVSSQNPIVVRNELAALLNIDPERLRVVAPAVGGGFGPKSHAYPEFAVTAQLARRLAQPLIWIETRSENMVSLTHGRGARLRGRLGLDAAGTIVGLDVDVTGDGGAYPALGAYLVELTRRMSQGVYAIPQIRYRGRAAATNTTPTGAYRGAGRPEAAQLIERLIDATARDHGFDPIELRRHNFLRPDAFPVLTNGDAHYDSGEYSAALDMAVAAADLPALTEEQLRRRRDGDIVQLGVGVATYVEITAPDGTHSEFGAVEVIPDGTVTVRVGTSAHGQGHQTSFAMIVADVMGVDMDVVKLVQSDTDSVPRGQGTFGSRSMQTAGNAIDQAARIVLERAKDVAADHFETDPFDVVAGTTGFHIRGVPAVTVSWGALATLASAPASPYAPLAAEIDFDQRDSTYPFGAHIAVVEVDTETGHVSLRRHIAVDDCGRIINPLLVTGQQHGGIAQGAAQALFEQVAYDADGNPQTNTLATYCIPSAADLPSFETHNTMTPSPRNPLGVKGIGESGTIGSTPAIHNAVIDALAHLGVRHIDMPLTPDRVWQAISLAAGQSKERP